MKSSQLNHLVKIIRHSGERCFIFDAETDAVLVLAPLADDLEAGNSGAGFPPPSADSRLPNDRLDWDAPEPEDTDDPYVAEQRHAPLTGQPKLNFNEELKVATPPTLDVPASVLATPASAPASPSPIPSALAAAEPILDLPEDAEEKFYPEPIS